YEVIAAILEYRSEGTVCRVGAVVILVYDGLLKLPIKKRDVPYIQIKAIPFCLLLDVDYFIIDIIVIDFPQFTDSFYIQTVIFLLMHSELQVILAVEYAIVDFDGKQRVFIAIVISYDQHLITYHS